MDWMHRLGHLTSIHWWQMFVKYTSRGTAALYVSRILTKRRTNLCQHKTRRGRWMDRNVYTQITRIDDVGLCLLWLYKIHWLTCNYAGEFPLAVDDTTMYMQLHYALFTLDAQDIYGCLFCASRVGLNITTYRIPTSLLHKVQLRLSQTPK